MEILKALYYIFKLLLSPGIIILVIITSIGYIIYGLYFWFVKRKQIIKNSQR